MPRTPASSSSSPPPPRPSLPTARIPVDTIPHLIPWPTLATYLLPLVSLAYPSLCAALDLPLTETGQFAYPLWAELWDYKFSLDVWDVLSKDDEADRLAFLLLTEYLEREKHAGATSWELAKVQNDQQALRARILDRWFRLFAIHIAHRQSIALKRAKDGRIRPLEDNPAFDTDERLTSLRQGSLYPSPFFQPPPYERHALVLSPTDDLAPFRLPVATNPHSSVDPAALFAALYPHLALQPFPPSLVALYPVGETSHSMNDASQPGGDSSSPPRTSLRPRARSSKHRGGDEWRRTGEKDSHASGFAAGLFRPTRGWFLLAT